MPTRPCRCRFILTTTTLWLYEGNELGKTEMWVVLDALAWRRGNSRSDRRRHVRGLSPWIEQGRLEPYLHRIQVRAGDHICVPAGLLHAIMGGLLIAEIQQNSNTTYRVYDWNRVGADGRPRPLHVDKALAVAYFSAR